jgi:crossover junction endodeoxyribonuclease RuvC
MTTARLVLGLDPSLSSTGWGLVSVEGSRLRHVANGQVPTRAADPLPLRLAALAEALDALIAAHRPDEAACEEVFVNKNPQSTLKLAQARGVVLAACGRAGLGVAEYAPSLVKQALVGTGRADKAQVEAMVRRLLPGTDPAGADAADALAVAITHAHHRRSAAARLPAPPLSPGRPRA